MPSLRNRRPQDEDLGRTGASCVFPDHLGSVGDSCQIGLNTGGHDDLRLLQNTSNCIYLSFFSDADGGITGGALRAVLDARRVVT